MDGTKKHVSEEPRRQQGLFKQLYSPVETQMASLHSMRPHFLKMLPMLRVPTPRIKPVVREPLNKKKIQITADISQLACHIAHGKCAINRSSDGTQYRRKIIAVISRIISDAL